MKKKLIRAGILSLIVVAILIHGYAKFNIIRISGCVDGSSILRPDEYKYVFAIEKFMPCYKFSFENEGCNLSEVHCNLTIVSEDASITVFERYWGEWKTPDFKTINILPNQIPSRLQSYELTLECRGGKHYKKTYTLGDVKQKQINEWENLYKNF